MVFPDGTVSSGASGRSVGGKAPYAGTWMKAVELSPKWAKAHYRLGMAYFKMGLYTDAATAFYAGCELAPTNKELSDMFRLALETGKRAYAKEQAEAAEKKSE